MLPTSLESGQTRASVPNSPGIRRDYSQLTGFPGCSQSCSWTRSPSGSQKHQRARLSAHRGPEGTKCVTAGTQVRRRANAGTHLLPRSIVPGASVSNSAGLDSRGFLIGQAGPGRHPVTSPPAVHRDAPLPGVGDVPGKLGLSSTKGWEPASYMGGPWWGVSRLPHRWSPPPSRLCRSPNG